MNLAVMQPYIFPYIGYFQLIQAADLFLIYDDVAYIKQGYINRNTILSPNGVTRFTVPVLGASSNKKISELAFSTNVSKVLKALEQSYSKAPQFPIVFPMIRETLEHEDRSVTMVCHNSYQAIFSYLGIEKQFKKTSEIDYDRTASARGRLITLCKKFNANCYINAPGGRSLYTKGDFSEQGVELKFIDSLPVKYKQNNHAFVPNLSIIDVLMHCSSDEIVKLMKQYELN
jgi:hypothetical protein